MRGSSSVMQFARSAPVRRLATFGVVAAIAVGCMSVTGASADPTTTPATAADAQTAWLAAGERAEMLNEQVLQAAESVSASAAGLAEADAAVTAAAAAVTGAEETKTRAEALIASYSGKLDAFANASFRGARMNNLTSFLTAESPDDLLDSVTALDRVAGDASTMLEEARAASAAAAAATAELVAKQHAAELAQQSAAAANQRAIDDQSALTTQQAALRTQVAGYQSLYNQLSEQEREAALAAEQSRLAALNPSVPAPAAGGTIEVEAANAVERTESAPAAVAPAGSAAATAVSAALSKVGSAYVFGAAGPDSFDCSGLTSWAWAQAGVSIPRTSSGQSGLPVVPLDQLQPGDLITYYSPVHHVGMYIGNGQIVHASTPSRPIYVTSISGGGPNPVGHHVG